MSFKVYVYYCALCGAWGAFLAWGLVRLGGLTSDLLVGAVLGGLVAGGVGGVDACLNAVGAQRLVRVLLCAALGLLGGALGGLLGRALTVVYLPLSVLGWVLAGSLIGASVGAYDLLRALLSGEAAVASLKKTLNGVYGGMLGGLIGGVVDYAFKGSYALPRSGLTISLVTLGGCIGLMVGLAQVILKEAWLKVEEGFRAGRELLLTRDETTLGRSESCDLGLFGDNSIARLHARVLLNKGRYELAHDAEDGETWLNGARVGRKPVPLRSGDRIQVGKSVLVFGERQKRRI